MMIRNGVAEELSRRIFPLHFYTRGPDIEHIYLINKV